MSPMHFRTVVSDRRVQPSKQERCEAFLELSRESLSEKQRCSEIRPFWEERMVPGINPEISVANWWLETRCGPVERRPFTLSSSRSSKVDSATPIDRQAYFGF
jgi:hypothetical protein